MARGSEPGKKRKKKLRWGRIFLVFGGVVFVIGLAFGVTCWDIWRYSKTDAKREADAAVVLGAAAWGPKPSPVFKARLDHAAELYGEGLVKAVVVTGGVGRLGGPSEAEVGKDYLVQHGVAESDVIEEDRSRRTFDNLKNAQNLMEGAGLTSCLVVSDPLHMRRAVAIAEGLGMNALPSPTHTSAYQSREEKTKFLMREGWFMFGYRLGLVR